MSSLSQIYPDTTLWVAYPDLSRHYTMSSQFLIYLHWHTVPHTPSIAFQKVGSVRPQMSVDKLKPNAEAWFTIALRPRKPEGSLGRTAQDGHLDSHTAPELWSLSGCRKPVLGVWLHCPFTHLNWVGLAVRPLLRMKRQNGILWAGFDWFRPRP